MEIWRTVREFISLIEDDISDVSDNRIKLTILLEKLSVGMKNIYGDVDDIDDDLLPDLNYDSIRLMVFKRFPDFGFYNIAFDYSVNFETEELDIGDAIDDVADIYIDLKRANEYNKYNREQMALWDLQFGYKSHWGQHLSDLQKYIYKLNKEE